MNRRAPRRDVESTAAKRQRGSTLIEILIASVIMSTAIIVLVGGMSALFSSSILNRQSTTAGVVARSYAEALEVAVAQTGAWCSATYTVTPSPPTPAGYTVSPAYGACPVNNATTPQFQTVTISVTATGGATEQLKMVVRKS